MHRSSVAAKGRGCDANKIIASFPFTWLSLCKVPPGWVYWRSRSYRTIDRRDGQRRSISIISDIARNNAVNNTRLNFISYPTARPFAKGQSLLRGQRIWWQSTLDKNDRGVAICFSKVRHVFQKLQENKNNRASKAIFCANYIGCQGMDFVIINSVVRTLMHT